MKVQLRQCRVGIERDRQRLGTVVTDTVGCGHDKLVNPQMTSNRTPKEQRRQHRVGLERVRQLTELLLRPFCSISHRQLCLLPAAHNGNGLV